MEETITVSLMSEKEGLFFFQHHNYEVSNTRRGSKVVRRYSDFVWLLECLHKRYPFRALPLLPPKRVAGMFHSKYPSIWTYTNVVQSTATTSPMTGPSSRNAVAASPGS